MPPANPTDDPPLTVWVVTESDWDYWAVVGVWVVEADAREVVSQLTAANPLGGDYDAEPYTLGEMASWAAKRRQTRKGPPPQ